MTAYDRVFAAVFPPSSEASIPTPSATPMLGSGGFEGSIDKESFSEWSQEDSATEQIRWDRAWHIATSFLALPSENLPPAYDNETRQRLHGKWFKEYTSHIAAAIKYLIDPEYSGGRLRKQQKNEDLLSWYFEEVGQRHFIHYVRPPMLQVI